MNWFCVGLVMAVLGGERWADGTDETERMPGAGGYFAIEVVDQETGRGVPMVELETTSSIRYYTDSNGLIAFFEPGLMNKKVWFGVAAHGYEFRADGLGMRGVALETRPGASVQLKIKRLNIAERLYRITGQGIYRDTVLLGRKAPIAEPLLNADVTGQDGILTAVYRGKIYWLYGDTTRVSYALGNFSMTGATTDLPGRIDPSVGFSLNYFRNKGGFVKAMAPIHGEGVVWLSGLVVVPDAKGEERMLAFYQRRRGLGAVLENGFVRYNDAKEIFEKVTEVPLEPAVWPQGYPFRESESESASASESEIARKTRRQAGKSKAGEMESGYIYFTAPYPAVRVKASQYLNIGAYEGYSCLKAGTQYVSKDQVELDRDGSGRLIWS